MRRVFNWFLFPITGLILAGVLFFLVGREGNASDTERAIWMFVGLAAGIVAAARVNELQDAP